MYFVGTFHRNYFAYITEIFQMQLFASLVFPYHNTLFLSFYFLPLCCFCQYIAKTHVYFVIHLTHQNDYFRTMGHATKLTFCNKILFFAEFKCVYKASLIICLHKYVNNSIYVFEPKFTKSRPMLSLKKQFCHIGRNKKGKHARLYSVWSA